MSNEPVTIATGTTAELTKADVAVVNIRNSWKMASNIFLALCAGVWGFYLSMTPAEQAAMVSSLPIPPQYLPFVTAVVGYLLRVYPQLNLSRQIEEQKVEKVIEKIDATRQPQ